MSIMIKLHDLISLEKIELKRSQSRLGAKPKVDSLSNVKYTPGGGSSKVHFL